jgi:predicted transcriptional regulator
MEMSKASKVPNRATVTLRISTKLMNYVDMAATRRHMSRAELARQALEQLAMDEMSMNSQRRSWIRRSIVRRCMICRAFVRSGFTCRTCRMTRWDSLVVEGNVVPIPSMTPFPVSARPDMRDSRWQIAEQVVLDAFSPLTGTIYELLTTNNSYEPTNLDEVRDLLVLAASINK